MDNPCHYLFYQLTKSYERNSDYNNPNVFQNYLLSIEPSFAERGHPFLLVLPLNGPGGQMHGMVRSG
jgi:hypothetical protein